MENFDFKKFQFFFDVKKRNGTIPELLLFLHKEVVSHLYYLLLYIV